MARKLLLTALVVLVSVSSLPRADACSPWRGGLLSVGPFLVRDGEDGVPTGIRPGALLKGDQGVAVRLLLRGPDGEEVEGTQLRERASAPQNGLVQFIPSKPLEPSTTYSFSAGQSDADAGVELFGEDFALSFTTGAGPDTTPPVFAGIESAVVTSKDVCDSGACCGPYITRNVLLSWGPASDDDRHWIRIEASNGSFLGFGGTNAARGEADCESGWDRPQADEAFRSTGPYRVRAVDRSGNVSASEAMLSPDTDCDDDIRPRSDGGADQAWELGGCGCGASDSTWCLALVATVLRRRRR